MPEVLNPSQIESYREQGFLVLPELIPDSIMAGLRAEIARISESARHLNESSDAIDLEDSHTPGNPRIRRIKVPHAQSRVFKDLLLSDTILAPVRDLLGPDLRLQSSKINLKSAQFGSAVEWHQDWAFYPCTNDDVLAVGIMIDDMRIENGPLMVFPGTHLDGVYDHHNHGVFAGAMDLEACGLDMKDAVTLTGPAGSVSMHHARIVHGSALNVSDRDRRIAFFEIMAADAFPIAGGRADWSGFEEFNSRMLCGRATFEPRVKACPVRVAFPDPPQQGSIYEIQKSMGRRSFETAQ